MDTNFICLYVSNFFNHLLGYPKYRHFRYILETQQKAEKKAKIWIFFVTWSTQLKNQTQYLLWCKVEWINLKLFETLLKIFKIRFSSGISCTGEKKVCQSLGKIWVECFSWNFISLNVLLTWKFCCFPLKILESFWN